MSNELVDDLLEGGGITKVSVALPTRARFYPKGEVIADGADPDDIAVSSIGLIEETALKDPLMLISGKAIAKMVKRVCPSVINPAELCDIDIQAILIASRIASYGPTFQTTMTCKCSHENRIEVDLNNHITRYSPYTPEEFEKFEITLESGQRVLLQPIRYADTVHMSIGGLRNTQTLQDYQDKVGDDPDAVLTEEFIRIYASTFENALEANATGITASIFMVWTKSGKPVTNPETIRGWVEQLPAPIIRQITDRIRSINDDIRQRARVEYQCQHCGELSSVYVELDPQKLFTHAGDSETETVSSASSKSTEKTTKARSRLSRR